MSGKSRQEAGGQSSGRLSPSSDLGALTLRGMRLTLLLAPLFGTGTINQGDFSLSGLLVSLVGAVILLAIVNLVRRGAVR